MLTKITMRFPDSTSRDGEVAHFGGHETRFIKAARCLRIITLRFSTHARVFNKFNFISYLLSLRDPHKCD
jgi:hypothetical protein